MVENGLKAKMQHLKACNINKAFNVFLKIDKNINNHPIT